MKKALKYILLILFASLSSIGIYEYINQNKSVALEDNDLYMQNEIEKSLLSTTNYSVDNPKVILNPYGNAPLSALIIFETNDLTASVITVKGKNGSDDLTHTFLPNKVHILPIYGLYADYDNEVLIEASGTSKIVHIKTDKLPDDFIKIEEIKGSLESDEFYFITPEDKNYTAAYDVNGNVRWYLTGDYKWDLTRLNNGHLLISSDKLINNPYYTKGFLEIDLMGKIYYEYNFPNGYHHSNLELENGNFLVSANNFNDGTVEDYIIEIDRNNGEVIKQWNLHKLQKNDKENWLGLNSLLYNASNNSITFAGSHADMIGNVDYASNEINWIIADSKNVPEKYQKYILKTNYKINNPSSLNYIDANTFYFVNSDDDGIYLVKGKVNLKEKTAEFETINKLDDNNISANIDVSGDDKYILTGDNYFKDVNGDEYLTVKTDAKLYNCKKLSLYANDFYTIGEGARLGSLGITETIKNISVFFHKTDDSIIDKYNLNFVKEPDRLVVTGTFSSDDEVEIILDNFLTKRTYKLTVSNTPYKSKDKNKKITVSKYINNEDVYGKFYIFIRINGENYKLNKYVIF